MRLVPASFKREAFAVALPFRRGFELHAPPPLPL
jgi:hypothetical protein